MSNETPMPRIFKEGTVTKTETRHLTAEIFGGRGLRTIIIRLDQEVTAHLTEWKDEWWYKPSGADSAEWQMAIGSTEEELVDWWVRSQGFQYVEDK
jgi:hypothetical protein